MRLPNPFRETKFSGANGDRVISTFLPVVQLTTRRISNLTGLILTLAISDDHTYIHTYIHTYNMHSNQKPHQLEICRQLEHNKTGRPGG